VPHLPYRRKRGEVKTETQKMSNRKKTLLEGGLWKEPTHGTIDLENCTQGIKRK
jgi:hypothetical protein